MVVTSLELTDRVEETYNLTVADWHTFMVGEDQTVVHNVNCKGLLLFSQSSSSRLCRAVTPKPQQAGYDADDRPLQRRRM